MGTLCIKACVFLVEHFFLNSERTKQFSFCDNHLCSHNCGSFHQKIAAWKLIFFFIVCNIWLWWLLQYFSWHTAAKLFETLKFDLIFSNTNLTSFIESKLLSALTRALLGFYVMVLWIVRSSMDVFGSKPIFSQFVRLSSKDDLKNLHETT